MRYDAAGAYVRARDYKESEDYGGLNRSMASFIFQATERAVGLICLVGLSHAHMHVILMQR